MRHHDNRITYSKLDCNSPRAVCWFNPTQTAWVTLHQLHIMYNRMQSYPSIRYKIVNNVDPYTSTKSIPSALDERVPCLFPAGVCYCSNRDQGHLSQLTRCWTGFSRGRHNRDITTRITTPPQTRDCVTQGRGPAISPSALFFDRRHHDMNLTNFLSTTFPEVNWHKFAFQWTKEESLISLVRIKQAMIVTVLQVVLYCCDTLLCWPVKPSFCSFVSNFCSNFWLEGRNTLYTKDREWQRSTGDHDSGSTAYETASNTPKRCRSHIEAGSAEE